MQTVDEKDLSPQEREALDKVLDEIVSVVVFHKATLDFAGKDIKRRHINAFATAVIDSFKKRNPDRAHSDTDFAIFIVNMETKNIAMQAIA